jgi:hypothetical protein
MPGLRPETGPFHFDGELIGVLIQSGKAVTFSYALQRLREMAEARRADWSDAEDAHWLVIGDLIALLEAGVPPLKRAGSRSA